ncbi:phosphopyruvate hydratase [Thermogladius sp. 4427co]|uniref:phosphopyruvate hydratase n=1 Tax=Thermogladius sp. 4427co TaxID=3450718 RepID=UPI003F78CB2F
MHVLQHTEYGESFLIKNVRARWVLDSRGNPTVQVKVMTEGLGVGVGYAPSGASTGTHEALELRDGGRDFQGKGVRNAVDNVNRILAPALIGMDSRRQYEIDMKMIEIDGTKNKARIGGNAIVATSIAVIKAAASTMEVPLYQYIGGKYASLLPVPMLNIINGGLHAGNKLDFQEFMIVPAGFSSFSEALKASVEIYGELRKILKERYGPQAINVGDEGGFAPPLEKTRDALDLLIASIKSAGYVPGDQVAIALDVASSRLYNPDKKTYTVEGAELNADSLIEYYSRLISDYPIVSIEDPFHEEDYETFARFTNEFGNRVLVVGDDLFVTNPDRLKKGISMRAANAILVKVNQVGTVSETLTVVELASSSGLRTIISHRSGETEDTFISDFAVGVRAGLIKTGAPARGERTAKYNRLLEIEEEVEKPQYPGFKVFPRKP